mgnify:CR=1 FL=1
MADRVLFVGPYPPPSHGTSIPFKQLVDFVQRYCNAEVFVVNTESGDKSGVPLYSPKAVWPFLLISIQVLGRGSICDTVICTGSQRFVATAGAFYTFILSTLLGKKVYICIRGGAFDVYYSSLSLLWRFFLWQCLNRAKVLIVQTNLVYTSLSGEFRNLAVVPNHRIIPSVREFNRAESTDDQKLIRFVYVGEVRCEKGMIELLEAYQKACHELKPKGISITLDIFGPTRSDFRDTFHSLLNAQDCLITYHGYVDHAVLMQQLGHFDALVLPTYFPSEGHPGVLIEAMALGLPVVTTRWRAIPEIVTHEENGLLCEPRDVGGLAECLIRIALDDQLRSRLGDKAQERARQFDANVVLPRLCALYDLKFRSQVDDESCH